jgi:hypothetical protein
MKNILNRLILLVLATCFLFSCTLLDHYRKQDYGVLKTAVTFSYEKVIGEYGDQIPADFDGKKFMELVKEKIPREYFSALKRYKPEIEPHGWYYLIKVYDGDNIILFDYSCTIEIEGPILDYPKTYDLNNLDKYDNCKNN